MTLSHFFIDRPRFATVISCLILIAGLGAYFELPVTQYPSISPPQVQVTANYPGANPETVAETVAAPLEQEINGIEGMLYLASQATSDGQLRINITFTPGTDIDTAQVLVQNRVSAALPRLPEEVRRLGVNTVKDSPDTLMVIHLLSPDGSHGSAYLGQYARYNVKDRLSRLDGVGSAQLFGASSYAMRLWLDPEKLSTFGLTADDVIAAVREQNVQVAGGVLNQTPSPSNNAFQLSIQTQGRFTNTDEFEQIIVKAAEDGALVLLKHVARVELGAESYTSIGYLDDQKAVAMMLTLRPGANALETADNVMTEMATLAEQFPAGVEYAVVYDTTEYVANAIDEVFNTLFISMILVIAVVLVFLQSWRTALIPVIAIPISLIGTFALMLAFGYSLNMLSLFGLVLAIGIVVDDAIVVVENVERRLAEGMAPVAATKRTMEEVGAALIATSLVLVAVFLPTVLMDGISGRFYQQFGVTIASATLISTVVSLTLSPAMAAMLMRAKTTSATSNVLHVPLARFNTALERLSARYGRLVAVTLRKGAVFGVVYLVLIGVSALQLVKIPQGFIPEQDQGYVFTAINLPPGATLARTDAMVQELGTVLRQIDGVEHTVAFSGFSAITSSLASNSGVIFTKLAPIEQRRHVNEILADMNTQLRQFDQAFIVAQAPPAVPGMGNAGGFKIMIQDKANQGYQSLEQATWALAMAANQAPEIGSAFTFFETATPRIFLDIDRERARQLQVPITRVFSAVEINVGSAYINDFSLDGRAARVTAQADAPFRLQPDDILRLKVRSSDDSMVPIGSIATIGYTAGPSRVVRYNLFPAAGIIGGAAAGFSTGQALDRVEQLAAQVLPKGFDFEWTEIAYQERATGNTAVFVFAFAVLFVFLLLAAQYESWTLPLAIILIVPMCLFSAGVGLLLTNSDNNILTQVGLIVLVGLASKNAILIVEFAKQYQDQHRANRWQAAIDAARTRLRPILMTAISFILGVVPLLIASGPGFEMRQAIGLTVFSGMLGVTAFGLLFTPLFYVFCRWLAGDRQAPQIS